MNPFNEVCDAYISRGYSVITVIPGEQIPGKYKFDPQTQQYTWIKTKRWEQFGNRIANDAEIKEWRTWPDAGIAIVLGKFSGLIGLDFDYDVDNLHSRIQSLIPDSPVKKFGSKGFTAFYRYSGECTKNWTANGKTVLELKSSTPGDDRKEHPSKTMLPPSIHWETREPYRWLTDRSLEDTEFFELPALPDNFKQLMDDLFAPYNRQPETQSAGTFSGEHDETTVEDVRRALSYIDPDIDMLSWVKVGMALKSEFGEDGFTLWDEWSQGGQKYALNRRDGTTRTRFNSFKRSGTTISTVFFLAQQQGWVFEPREREKQPQSRIFAPSTGRLATVLSPYMEVLPNETQPICEPEKQEGPSVVPPTLEIITESPKISAHIEEEKELLNAPGIVGKVSQWMGETALYPQPFLELCAALGVCAVGKAQKVRSHTGKGLRTNLYLMGIAYSGSGKNHGRDCVSEILIKSNQSELMGTELTSAPGILNHLNNAGGKRLIMADEIGYLLSSFSGKNAQSYQAQIPPLLMKLFNESHKKFMGAEYANSDGKRPRIDIEQPCLSLYGTSVPGRFYEGLTVKQAEDGFLSRLLIFEEKEFLIKKNKNQKNLPVPDHILDYFNFWREEPSNCDPQGTLDMIFTINPQVIQPTPEVESDIESFQELCRMEAWKRYSKGDGLGAIYTRTAEHAIKLALTAFEGKKIDSTIWQWASQVALNRSYHLETSVREHISDNSSDQELKRVLKIISSSENGTITKSDLTRKTSFLQGRRRDEIIGDLLESCKIEEFKEKPGQKVRTSYRLIKDYR